MRPRIVAVRCFAEQTRSGWEAHCVDLGLTVRGDSLEHVKRDLDALVHRMLDDRLVKRRSTVPRQHAARLGALALRLRYWGLRVAGGLGFRRDALRNHAGQRRARPMSVRSAARVRVAS